MIDAVHTAAGVACNQEYQTREAGDSLQIAAMASPSAPWASASAGHRATVKAPFGRNPSPFVSESKR